MIKHFFLVVLLFASSITMQANAQETESVHDRLAVKFSETELTEMNTEEAAFWEYFVTAGFIVYDITKDPSESDILHLDFKGATEHFNPLAYGLLPEKTAVNTYQLGNTGKGVMILSKAKIRAKMNRNK